MHGHLIVHIGPKKTGTTELQTTLHQNRKLLQDAGILYPKGRWHAEIASYFSGSSSGFVFNRQSGIADQVQIAERDRQAIDTLLEQLSETRYEAVILSYEGLISLSKDNIAGLVEYFRPHFKKIIFHAYARHALAFVTSEFSQLARMGHARTRDQALRKCHFSFREVFEKFRGHGKNVKLIVRDFDSDKLVDGDVVSDFLSAHGLREFSARMKREGIKRNPSLSAEAIQVALELAKLDTESMKVGRFFQKYKPYLDGIEGGKFILTEEEYEEVRHWFVPEIEYLRSEFGIELREPVFEKYSQGWAINEATARSFAKLIYDFASASENPLMEKSHAR